MRTPKLELICIVFLLVIFLSKTEAYVPCYTVDYMCDKSDLIAEGTYLGKDMVKIKKVYKEPEGANIEGREIEIVKLGRHNRKVGGLGEKNTSEITTKKLFLFLNHAEDGNAWEPIGIVEENNHCGSSGIKWFDDNILHSILYHYVPFISDGPLSLVPADKVEFPKLPKTVDEMTTEIKTGLENSKRWKETLAIADPKKKAEALSKYLLKTTAPEGDKGTYETEVFEQLITLKGDAVPFLIEAMKNVPEDDKFRMNNIVLIIYNIGPDAKPALPHLYELLSSPERAYTGYVLSAIRTIGDPESIPHIRPFLKSEEFRVAVTAAQALTALKDTDSFDKMAAIVPEEPTEENGQANYLCDLLNALYEMNPEKAKPIIEKTARHPVMAKRRAVIKGLQK